MLTMFFGLLAYFLVSPVSQTYLTGIGISANMAVGAVMIGSIANAAARLILPSLADRIGRKKCVGGILILSVISMGMLFLFKNMIAVGAIVLTYGCYGGIMGNFPAFTSSLFGVEHSAENYGFVMLGMILSSIAAPVISAGIIDTGLGSQILFGIGMISAALALICCALIKTK